ncbi:MAG: septal ring lytic transglycosylase RlpA family protein [Gammaproteobacteria bacterium]|nr:septal ring lytic transglycosylase RlpA family protein [Gammaproteobacteria bacterium]MBU1601391.1 septal ring lytic transglycosylase RlpA family protein [Gammaproteobacteria bacterium]MBU2433586.1 septal ring lytic transglycosylase RlpA family protein [Gammaproteobacteria bacterium]MBU2449877.1 septal ring lytic transglycosylase RlpA family protein [Gammaproteobacteria bacterium]
MTKRRPSSSKDAWRAAAIIVGGLLLLNGWSSVRAASNKPPHPVASKASHAEPAPAFGPADLIEDGTPGLRGLASFYGKKFDGRQTATGERFDARQFTAASNRFPLGTLLAVRRADNDRCAIVKVNDRMHRKHRKRIIDVSRSVAEYLGMVRAGVVFVSVAPVKNGRPAAGSAVCLAAFAPEPECESCGQPQKMPEFLPPIEN